MCGYVYADAGAGESSTDLVFAGHNMVAENGTLLAETRFNTGLTISEIDVDRLVYERRSDEYVYAPRYHADGAGPRPWSIPYLLFSGGVGHGADPLCISQPLCPSGRAGPGGTVR